MLQHTACQHKWKGGPFNTHAPCCHDSDIPQHLSLLRYDLLCYAIARLCFIQEEGRQTSDVLKRTCCAIDAAVPVMEDFLDATHTKIVEDTCCKRGWLLDA